MGLIEPAKITTKLTRGALATILREASIQAAETISGNLQGVVAPRSLERAMVGIGSLSNELWSQINTQIQQGVKDAALLAVDQQFLREIQLGMPDDVLQTLLPGLHFNALQAANDILSRRTNGFTLSQRIYRNSQAGVMAVGTIVDRGLALQLSAREIAAQVRGYYHPSVPGGASYAAMRLARTEINNAHHDTTIRVSKERPWVKGYKWNLSGSHPRPDICNTYADKEVFSTANVPNKPHPQCLERVMFCNC
jgi:hypothetical protein